MSNTPKSGSSPPKPKAGRPKKIKEPSTESSAVEWVLPIYLNDKTKLYVGICYYDRYYLIIFENYTNK